MADQRSQVTIYTDGGADPNPGPGGWAAILIHTQSGTIKELSGGEPETTNNRMELTAAIQALESLRFPCEVTFYTDSEYLRRGITDWLPGWIAANWRGKKGAIQNVDLWRSLAQEASRHDIRWEWVKGHAGNRHNERADFLASQEIRRHHAKGRAQPVDAEIFVRVSCVGSKGGWAALIRRAGAEQIISGSLRDATANQLDIHVAVEALRAAPDAHSVRIWSGSDYLRNGATQWLDVWQKQGWKTKGGQPVKNQPAWQALAALTTGRVVDWPPAKGRTIPEFSRLDAIAREEIARA